MKSTAVFHVREGMIKFLQAQGVQKRLISAVDVLTTDDLDDEGISGRLKSWVKEKRMSFKDTHVTILIPRTHCILRHMTLPSQVEGEIRSMIDLQVVNHIPYAREDVEIDFQILSKTEDGYSKVLAVIIPHEVSQRYWDIFKNANIPVDSMTISSVGLWLLYRQQAEADSHMASILDVDINQTEICICNNQYWWTSREVPAGLVQIDNSGVDELIKQWELTHKPTSLEKNPTPVNLVYLVSTAGLNNGLNAALSKDGVTVKELHLLNSLPTAKNVVWPKLWMNEGASVAALAGIALSPTLPPPIDLVPHAVRQDEQTSQRRRDMIVLGFWAMAAIVSLALALSVGFIKKNAQLSALEQELSSAKKQASIVEKQLEQLQKIEEVFKDRLIFMDVAAEIYRLLPRQLSLIGLSITNGNTLSLQGISSQEGDINQLQKNLVDSPFLSNVNLDYVNKRITQEGEIKYFKITCLIKSAKDNDEKTE